MSSLRTFLSALADNPDLKDELREVSSAEDFVKVAARAGFEFQPLDLVDALCTALSSGSEQERIEAFDACSWDYGELAWLLKTIVERQG